METKPGDLEGLVQSSSKALEKEAGNTNPQQKDPAPPSASSDVPDPDEDDLDDLDDMLDEFIPPKPEPKAPTGPGRPPATSTIPDAEAGLSDEDFAKQLQEGMADLLGGLETSPDMQAQFAAMLKELGGVAGLGGEATDSGVAASSGTPGKESKSAKSVPSTSTAAQTVPTGSTTGAEESFQETIKKTMERMRASGDSATAAAATESTSESDLMAEMMKAMQGADLGEGGEEDFSKMLLGMMEQLTNKEILYEPMKELHDKFPEWMARNGEAGKVDEGDMKRYKEQQVYVKEIVERFERKEYSDDNAGDREYIVERMQKMQAAGSPPADLVGDMAAAQEAFGAPEEGCPQQ